MFKVVTDSIAVGSANQKQDLQKIAQRGYASIIDLCPAAEGTQLNASQVEQLNLAYVSVPISPKSLSPETLASFQQAVQTSPQPIYIRCASGLRAGVFTLLTLAGQQGWDETQYLEQLRKLEIEHKPNCPLSDFAHTYFVQEPDKNQKST